MAKASSVSNGGIIKATIASRVQRDIGGPKGWYRPGSRCSARANAIRAEERASSIQDRSSCERDGVSDRKVNFKNVSRCVVRDSRLNIKANKIIK